MFIYLLHKMVGWEDRLPTHIHFEILSTNIRMFQQINNLIVIEGANTCNILFLKTLLGSFILGVSAYTYEPWQG